jgi:hypothetical protein
MIYIYLTYAGVGHECVAVPTLFFLHCANVGSTSSLFWLGRGWPLKQKCVLYCVSR